MTDLSGRDRMVRNVFTSWGGHLVVMAAGFVMPRLMDDYIGQTGLGVWDFGWSIVSYFGLAQGGIGSSVNRYVAKYRAARDLEGLNRAISSVMAVQLAASVLVLALSVGATIVVPRMTEGRLGPYVNDAQWVVMFLGASLAVQVAFDAYSGVITGCHRWDLHTGLNAGFYAASACGMIVSLLLGGGLRSVAIVYFCGVCLTEVTRAVVAHHACPELRVRWRTADWDQALEMLRFGGKVLLASISSLLLYQTNSLLIVNALGAGALARYMRPLALVRHTRIIVEKFGSVMTPTVSSLQAAGNPDEVRALLVQSTRYGAHIALPPLLLLAILGGPILRLWMGARYQQGELLAVLALGHLISIAHGPVFNVLAGLNRHGKPSLAHFVGAVAMIPLWTVGVGLLKLELIGAALAVCIPLTLVHGIYTPWYACRELRVPLMGYFADVWSRPVMAVGPFAACLVAARSLLPSHPYVGLAVGLTIGGAALAVSYWYWVLPPPIRDLAIARIIGARRAGRATASLARTDVGVPLGHP